MESKLKRKRKNRAKKLREAIERKSVRRVEKSGTIVTIVHYYRINFMYICLCVSLLTIPDVSSGKHHMHTRTHKYIYTHTNTQYGSVRQQQEQKNCDTLQLSGVAMCMYRSNQFHWKANKSNTKNNWTQENSTQIILLCTMNGRLSLDPETKWKKIIIIF